jgi:sec-independent protein translocase protein TatA
LVFGAKRLPEIGRSLGSGMREFKQSVTGEASSHQTHNALPAAEQQQAQPAQTAPAGQPAAAPAAPPPTPVEHK